MHLFGRHKTYAFVVFGALVICGMILVLIFENCGIARKESNLSMRLANSIQVAQLKLEKSHFASSNSHLLQQSLIPNLNKIIDNHDDKREKAIRIQEFIYNSIYNESGFYIESSDFQSK